MENVTQKTDELRITNGDQTAEDNGPPETEGKPTLGSAALCGLAGEIVKTIEPYTEADPVAVLANILTGFGNIIGRRPHFMVDKTPHFANLYVVLIGPTGKARKGMSWSTPKWMFGEIDSGWVTDRIQSGLSSGEGFIYAVRDSADLDRGVSDKRLLVVEEEFAQPLKVMRRDGNTLSPTIRIAWDDGNLRILTKNNPVKATSGHISIIGHITQDELYRDLTQTDMANGFANRFIWLYVERSKYIDSPTGVPPEKLNPLVERLREAVQFAQSPREMTRDPEAKKLWAEVYPNLCEGRPGLAGAITSRAEAQVLRLSMIYALMDRSALIKLEHLQAALALWDYCEKSVELIFADRTGDRNVDMVARLLKVFGKISRTQIYLLLGKNAHKQEIDRIIKVLCTSGRAESRTENNKDVLYPKY